MKFRSPELALYLYKSVIQSCTEYCCHICAGAPSCCLELLDKLQKRHLLPLLNPWLIVEMQPAQVFSIGIILLVHLNWLSWFHFLILEGVLLIVVIDCMIFLSLFLDVTSMSMSTVSFLAQLGYGVLCLQNAFISPVICSTANKYYSSAGHHEQKNKKVTGQFKVVTRKQRIKLVL